MPPSNHEVTTNEPQPHYIQQQAHPINHSQPMATSSITPSQTKAKIFQCNNEESQPPDSSQSHESYSPQTHVEDTTPEAPPDCGQGFVIEKRRKAIKVFSHTIAKNVYSKHCLNPTGTLTSLIILRVVHIRMFLLTIKYCSSGNHL